MKKLILLSTLLLSVNVFSQNFPKIEGTTLEGKSISLPISNGKYSVIAMVYNKAAEVQLKEWLNPLYTSYAQKSSKPATFDMSEAQDVNFVFVPMISGFAAINKEYKSNTDKGFWPYIMDTERSDMRAIEKQMKIADNKIPYIYVVNDKGEIVETQSGKYTKAKMDKIDEALDNDEN